MKRKKRELLSPSAARCCGGVVVGGSIVGTCGLQYYFEECENHTYDETENGRWDIWEEESETFIDPIG